MDTTHEHIQESLICYYTLSIIEDEQERAKRNPSPPVYHPKFEKWSTNNPDSNVLEFIQDLEEELSSYGRNYISWVDLFCKDYQISLNKDSDTHYYLYRELLKVNLQILLTKLKRKEGDYSDELAYLNGHRSIIDFSMICGKRIKEHYSFSEYFAFLQRRKKELDSSAKGVQSKKETTDLKYSEFDTCVLGILNQIPENKKLPTDKTLARECEAFVIQDSEKPLKFGTIRKHAGEVRKKWMEK